MSAFLEIIKSNIKNRLAYRFDFFMDTLFQPILFIVIQIIWIAVYSLNNISEINGFTLQDTITYAALSAIVNIFIYSSVLNIVGQHISSGDFSKFVVLPIHYLKFQTAQAIGAKIPSWLFKAPLVLILLILVFNIQFTSNIALWLVFGLSVLISFLLYNTFMFLIGLFTFWEDAYWTLEMLAGAILVFFSGELLPLEFYPPFLRTVVEILPFKHIYYSPIMVLLGKYTLFESLIIVFQQLIFLAVLIIASDLLLKFAMKKFTSQGG